MTRDHAYRAVVSDSEQSRKPLIALPTPHLMALAPLDVWARLLWTNKGVHPRYWGRTAFALFTSFVGTICSVHDRVLVFPFRMSKFRRDPVFKHKPGVVVVIGYYRSGTTHLHNLLSCDPAVVTPRWYQVLAPQGYFLCWALIRVMLVPFLPSTRPQDGVGFGPEWPAEDDFALCNWGLCSTLPARFVFPSRWEAWQQWNTLEDLSEAKRNRWRSLTAAFCFKITRGRNRTKLLVLKSPSHTPKVEELDRLFAGNVRFVHIARDPENVIDSNVNMHLRLRPHLLEDGPCAQEIRDRIVEEYELMENACDEQLATIDPSRVARVRHMDLVNDPIAQLERIYTELGLGFSDDARERTIGYLHETGSYRTPSAKRSTDLGERSDRESRICDQLRLLHRLDEAPVDVVPIDRFSMKERAPRSLARGVLGACLACIVFVCAWASLVAILHYALPQTHMKINQLVWVLGAVVGLGANRAGRGGSLSLGIYAILVTFLGWIAATYWTTDIVWDHGNGGWDTVYHNFKGVWVGNTSMTAMLFGVLAMLTAYRQAARTGPTPPGR